MNYLNPKKWKNGPFIYWKDGSGHILPEYPAEYILLSGESLRYNNGVTPFDGWVVTPAKDFTALPNELPDYYEKGVKK